MMIRTGVLALTFLSGLGFMARTERFEPVTIRQALDGFPMSIGAWQGRRAANFDAKIMTILGVDEYLNRTYARAAAPPVGVYIGYYQSQRQGDTIHSPLNCLPGAGWSPVAKSELAIPVASSTGPGASARTIHVNRYIIQKGEQKQVVLYWYQSQGRVVASEYWSKIYMVLDAVKTSRTDASLVRVIAPVADLSAEAEAAAEAEAVQFVKQLFPLLGQYLPS